MNSTTPKLILASSSPYRKELLSRYGKPFITESPDIDEAELEGETIATTAVRLAIEKATIIAKKHPGAIVIGSDQIAEVMGTRLNKPGNKENAIQQLRFMSGKTVNFLTAVAVVKDSFLEHSLVTTAVRFKKLTTAQIESYVEREPSFDCAGSAKIEGLGITLVEAIITDDPTAIIGLPLINLVKHLEAAGCVF